MVHLEGVKNAPVFLKWVRVFTIARPSYDHRTILDVILAISLVRSSYDHRALGLRRIYEKSNILGSHDHRTIIVRNARWSCDARPNLAIQTHVQIGRVFCTFVGAGDKQ